MHGLIGVSIYSWELKWLVQISIVLILYIVANDFYLQALMIVFFDAVIIQNLVPNCNVCNHLLKREML